jgi:hypothetical protein
MLEGEEWIVVPDETIQYSTLKATQGKQPGAIGAAQQSLVH